MDQRPQRHRPVNHVGFTRKQRLMDKASTPVADLLASPPIGPATPAAAPPNGVAPTGSADLAALLDEPKGAPLLPKTGGMARRTGADLDRCRALGIGRYAAAPMRRQTTRRSRSCAAI